MADLNVVEQCGHCGADFTNWWQHPPCAMDCPFHREFRIRETKIAESIRALGLPPKHKECGNHLTAIDIKTDDGAHLTWECKPCKLLFEVEDISRV